MNAPTRLILGFVFNNYFDSLPGFTPKDYFAINALPLSWGVLHRRGLSNRKASDGLSRVQLPGIEI